MCLWPDGVVEIDEVSSVVVEDADEHFPDTGVTFPISRDDNVDTLSSVDGSIYPKGYQVFSVKTWERSTGIEERPERQSRTVELTVYC